MYFQNEIGKIAICLNTVCLSRGEKNPR